MPENSYIFIPINYEGNLEWPLVQVLEKCDRVEKFCTRVVLAICFKLLSQSISVLTLGIYQYHLFQEPLVQLASIELLQRIIKPIVLKIMTKTSTSMKLTSTSDIHVCNSLNSKKVTPGINKWIQRRK